MTRRSRRTQPSARPSSMRARPARRSRSMASPITPAQSRSGCRRPDGTTPPMRWAWPAQPRSLGVPMGDIVHGLETFPRGRSPARAQGRVRRRRRLRRLRPPSDRDTRHDRGGPAARTGASHLGGLRAADVPSNGRSHRRVRGVARDRRRGRHRRYLGRPGSGHDDRFGRGSRGYGSDRSLGHPGRGAWLGGSDEPVAGSQCPSRRRRPGDGWRPSDRIATDLLERLDRETGSR